MFSTAFSIAGSGLRTMQTVVETGSANIANAHTPGYRRRDEALSELFGGGVSTQTVHRFNEATASRLTQLSAEVSYQDTLAQALRQTQAQMSDAASLAAQSLDSLRTAIGAMTVAPAQPQAREAVAQKARSLTQVANTHLEGLDHQAAQLEGERSTTVAAAHAVLAQAHELNRAVLRHGPLPELRNELAQRALEMGELTGASLRFNANGTAVLSIGDTSVLDGDVKGELPAVLGGKAAALDAAAANARASRNEMQAALAAFASRMNAANHKGTDAAGQPGGDIFEASASGLRFVGSAERFAFSEATALEAHNVANFLEVSGLGQDLGAIAVRTAQQSTAAQGLAGAHGRILQSVQERQQREEGVDVDFEISRVKQAQRLYEANAKLIQVADAMLGSLLSIRA